MELENPRVRDCFYIELPLFQEQERGSLCFAELGTHIDFEIKRFFFISNVPVGASRAHHANQFTKQVFFCLRGSVKVEIDDGKNKDSVILSKQNVGLFLGEMLWRSIFFLEEDTLFLVICSTCYDKDDYITDYNIFLEKTR